MRNIKGLLWENKLKAPKVGELQSLAYNVEAADNYARLSSTYDLRRSAAAMSAFTSYRSQGFNFNNQESDVSPVNYAGISKAISSGVNSMAPLVNAAFAPNITKVQGDFSLDTLTNAMLLNYTYYEVDDIIEAARIYESNGYAVSIMSIENLLSPYNHVCNNRLMYDFIQCDEMNIAANNCMIPNNILEDIKNRFFAGLRLWHTVRKSNDIIELKSAEYSINLGQVCIKDNLEV